MRRFQYVKYKQITEFTNALLAVKSKHKTMFGQALEELGIEYNRIRVATPRHNGKVERENRQDEERFYKNMRMYNLEDGRKQLAVYQRKSNNYIKESRKSIISDRTCCQGQVVFCFAKSPPYS